MLNENAAAPVMDAAYALTSADEAILREYGKIVELLGRMLGDNCEVVLHSLKDLHQSVIAIHNGAKNGRGVGSPVTNTALTVLSKAEQDRANDVYGPYGTQSRSGHSMRSGTAVIRNPAGQPIGLLCMNLDLDMPLRQFFDALRIMAPSVDSPEEPAEFFARDLPDLIKSTADKIKAEIMADDSIPLRKKNGEIVERLYAAGLFRFRNSVEEAAHALNITRDTIYMHLRRLRVDGSHEGGNRG